MGAQFSKQEVNAAIARLMHEESLEPTPDYLNDEIDQERFLGVAEMAVKETDPEGWERYQILCQCSESKVIAMVAILRLMDV